MIPIIIIIFDMSCLDMDEIVHLMLSMFDSGEEFPHLPFMGLLLFCGNAFKSSDFVLHSFVEGVIVFVLVFFLFVKNEVTPLLL